jgi:hypothetical protein
MPLSAVEVISPAFEHMTRQLFKPFRLGQWARLAVIGLLAGELGSGGSSNARMLFSSFPNRGGSGSDGFPAPVEFSPGLAAGIALLGLLAIVLTIVFMYISARLRFVLFDSVVAGESHVRESWRRRGEQGFRYFVFQILYMFAAFGGFLLLVGVPLLGTYLLGWFQAPREHILGFVLTGGVFLLVFLAYIFTLLLVQVLIKDFVVPQMALEGVTVGQGWSRLRAMMTEEKRGYAGYIGMKIVLGFVSAFVLGMATLAVVVVLLIPFGGLGVVAMVAGNAAGLTWNPVTIAVAVVGVAVALICFFVLAALVSVPAIVFFPAYSIYFFAERYAPLKAALMST